MSCAAERLPVEDVAQGPRWLGQGVEGGGGVGRGGCVAPRRRGGCRRGPWAAEGAGLIWSWWSEEPSRTHGAGGRSGAWGGLRLCRANPGAGGGHLSWGQSTELTELTQHTANTQGPGCRMDREVPAVRSPWPYPGRSPGGRTQADCLSQLLPRSRQLGSRGDSQGQNEVPRALLQLHS